MQNTAASEGLAARRHSRKVGLPTEEDNRQMWQLYESFEKKLHEQQQGSAGKAKM